MSIDHIIRRICNLRIEEVILVGDNTTLLEYTYKFMKTLHVVDSRARTQATPCNYIGY